MSRIHHRFYLLIAMLSVAIPALSPRAARAQEIAPTISNMPSIRRRLEAAATSLVSADEALIGTERSVRVRIIVAADGRIDSTAVQQSSGNTSVDSTALTIVRTARFTPGSTAGVPMRSVVVLPLRFVFPDE